MGSKVRGAKLVKIILKKILIAIDFLKLIILKTKLSYQ